MYDTLIKKSFEGAINSDPVVRLGNFSFDVRIGKRVRMINKQIQNIGTTGCFSKSEILQYLLIRVSHNLMTVFPIEALTSYDKYHCPDLKVPRESPIQQSVHP